jgi:hypothetical protein
MLARLDNGWDAHTFLRRLAAQTRTCMRLMLLM